MNKGPYAALIDWFARNERPDVIHGNYWLSGLVGHRLKHELDVPFVSTFHTLARVKAAHGDPEPDWRDRPMPPRDARSVAWSTWRRWRSPVPRTSSPPTCGSPSIRPSAVG